MTLIFKLLTNVNEIDGIRFECNWCLVLGLSREGMRSIFYVCFVFVFFFS